jgi:hypothetical protein
VNLKCSGKQHTWKATYLESILEVELEEVVQAEIRLEVTEDSKAGTHEHNIT